MAGWIRIDRDIRLHWIWSDTLYYKWWTDLLMEAAWEDTSWYSGSKSYPLKRGQLAASVSYLRERWSYTDRITSKRYTPSPNTVLNFLKKLEEEGMIKRYCDILPRAITVIEIVNYPKYQDVNIAETDPPNNSGNNGGNNGGCKHINNINNIIEEDNISCAREKILNFLKEYFNAKNSSSLEQILMGLHRENPNTKTIKDFKRLAWEAVSEWEQNKDIPEGYTEMSKKLLAHVRIKNRIKNGNTSTYRRNDADNDKQKRDEDFARHIIDKLSRGDMPSDVSEWY